MKRVVIVECISTSMNYVHDLRKLGFEPIILETYNEDGGHQEARRQENYKAMEKPLPARFQASKYYDQTLLLVKELDPVLVLPGSEMSVELATNLANDLGLPCNPKKNLPQMTRKSEMHEALRRAGLRYIRGIMANTLEEAVEFFHSLGSIPVVLKPTHSAGSLSVFVCANEAEIQNGFEQIFGSTDMFGGKNTQVLVQECIMGEEFIVNTVSREGKSYITSMYRYTKIQLPGGAKLYDVTENIMQYDLDHHPEYHDMMQYALDVNRAIGIQYGPVHAEFMIDKNGPVLIEVNCRICGGDMTAEFLDAMHGHHETNRSLEAYLDGNKFAQRMDEGYNPAGKGYFKTIITPYECKITDAPVVRFARKLPSFICTSGLEEHTQKHMPRTIDLYTNGGKIALAHPSYTVATFDHAKLDNLLKNHFEDAFTLNNH